MENICIFPSKNNLQYHATLTNCLRPKSPIQTYKLSVSSKAKRSASNSRRTSKTLLYAAQTPDNNEKKGCSNQRNSNKLRNSPMTLHCSGRKMKDVNSTYLQLRTIGSNTEYVTSNKNMSRFLHRATKDVVRAYGAFFGHARSISSRRKPTPTGNRLIKETSFREACLRCRSRQRREHNQTVMEARILPQSRRTASKNNESISRELKTNTWLRQKLIANKPISETPVCSMQRKERPKLNSQIFFRPYVRKIDSQDRDFGLRQAIPESEKKPPLVLIQRKKNIIQQNNSHGVSQVLPNSLQNLIGFGKKKLSQPAPPLKPPPAQLGRTHKIVGRKKIISPTIQEESTPEDSKNSILNIDKINESSINRMHNKGISRHAKPIEICRIPLEMLSKKIDCNTNIYPEDLINQRKNFELDMPKKDDCDSVVIDSGESSRSLSFTKSPRANIESVKHSRMDTLSNKSGKSPFSEIIDGRISEYLGNHSYTLNSKTLPDTAEMKTKLQINSETDNSKGTTFSLAQHPSSRQSGKKLNIEDSIIQITSSLESYESVEEEKKKKIGLILSHTSY